MTKKVYYSDSDIRYCVHEIIRGLYKENWKPDYIVGLTRGGLIPSVMISQYLGIPLETLKVSLTYGGECESNCWMPEDAVGCNFDNPTGLQKKILIVDDINDEGNTLAWIKRDWYASIQGTCTEERWNEIWGDNIRIAVLVNNEASKYQEVNYIGDSINKFEDPSWIVFPWENWWSN